MLSPPKRNWLSRMKAVKVKMQTTHERKPGHRKSKEDGGNTVLLPMLSTIPQYRFNTSAIKSKYIRERHFERSEKMAKKTEGMVFQLSNGLKISVRAWCEISVLSDKTHIQTPGAPSPHLQKNPTLAFWASKTIQLI